jgi:acyl-CoA synthetase
MGGHTVREFVPRPAPAALRERWLSEELWNDDTFAALTAEGLARNANARARVLSAVRPFDGRIADLADQGARLAGLLEQRGVGAGDVVAFQLPNWAEAAATFYGLLHLGAVLVPIVHIYGHKEVGHILRQSGARVLITADRFGSQDFLGNLEVLRGTLPDLELVIVVDAHGRAPRVPPESMTWREVLSAGEPSGGIAHVDPDAPVVIGYTSGTTSAPKGVVHTHRTLLAEMRQMAAHRGTDRAPAPPVTPLGTLSAAPVSHITGLLGVLGPILTGEALHLLDHWDAGLVLRTMRAEQLTSGGGATFFLNSLLDDPEFDPAVHVPLLARVGMGGSPIPAEIARRASELGISITRAYGSTEHPSITMSVHSDPEDARLCTDGRVLPGVELRLVDDHGRDVARGEPGEIVSRGPDLFVGYVDPALTAEAIDADGWFATGDVGVLDERGYLSITDRKKDIIIRGGENISAAEVEELIQCMPGVFEVAVVAAPDPRYGEHGCAFVRLAAGGELFGLEAMREHLERAGLARQKWPEEQRFVDDFPRTASGKIQKHILRERLR